MNNTVYFYFIFTLISCKQNNNKIPILTYDVNLGKGHFKQINFNPNDSLLTKKGEKLFIKSCVPCHAYNTKHSNGPSWEGITERFHPVWILNFMTNTEEMLNFDPYLQKQIKQYKLKMPSFNLDTNDAKALYSFMYLKDNTLYGKN
ncbi:MAG: c-type cytochrome [Flavobacteriia bacterium]|nr:c-type cytochrome [Flavobacteriia bacterium]